MCAVSLTSEGAETPQKLVSSDTQTHTHAHPPIRRQQRKRLIKKKKKKGKEKEKEKWNVWTQSSKVKSLRYFLFFFCLFLRV